MMLHCKRKHPSFHETLAFTCHAVRPSGFIFGAQFGHFDEEKLPGPRQLNPPLLDALGFLLSSACTFKGSKRVLVVGVTLFRR